MEAFSSGECKKLTISLLSFSTPFPFSRDWHAMPCFCTPNLLTCEHFKSTDAFGILLAGFYESVLLCISHNNPCHWMLGPQMMQTKLQLLHSYYNSEVHTCTKGLFILNRGLQIFNLNPMTQYYMMENVSFFSFFFFLAIGNTCLFWLLLRVRALNWDCISLVQIMIEERMNRVIEI